MRETDRDTSPVQPIAVALGREATPDAGGEVRLLAKGRGAVAEQILALAFANGVKVREDADLASALSAIELECPVPLEVFTVVAAILTRVYQANGEPIPADIARAAAP